MTKNAPTEKLDQRGNPYSGIQLDLQMMKCSFFLPAIAKKRTNAPYLFSILWIPFVFSVGLIDAPLSLVADTIFLPIDYFVFAEVQKPRLSGSCEDGA